MSTDYIQSLNIGTGLNTTQIVDAIVDARRVTKESLINKKIEQRQTQVSALGELKSSLVKFNSNSTIYDGVNGLNVGVNGTSFTGTISDNDVAKPVSHSITVNALAQSQTLVFNGYSSATDTLGTGTLSFNFGTWANGSFTSNGTSSSTVEIESGSDDITSIAAAINDADIGVTASVIEQSEDNFALIMRSSTGLNNAMSISVSEDDASQSLSDLDFSSFDATVQASAASDASVTIDGVNVTRSSNSISDLVDGYTIDLNSVSSGAEQFSSLYDADVALVAAQAFVSELNTVLSKLNALYDRGGNGGVKGELAGSPLVRSLTNKVRSLMAADLDGFGDNGINLASFGVQTNRDGSISLNAETFERQYELNPDHFNAILNSRVTSNSSAVSASIAGENYTPGSYALEIDNNVATIGSDPMTLSGGIHHISSGDASGLSIETDSSSLNTTIYIGSSLLDKMTSFFEDAVSIGSDINDTVSQFNSDISNLNDDLTKFQTQMEKLRTTYLQQFTAMDIAVAELDSTKELLNGFMDSWKASLKG